VHILTGPSSVEGEGRNMRPTRLGIDPNNTLPNNNSHPRNFRGKSCLFPETLPVPPPPLPPKPQDLHHKSSLASRPGLVWLLLPPDGTYRAMHRTLSSQLVDGIKRVEDLDNCRKMHRPSPRFPIPAPSPPCKASTGLG
jgi:hypothetical protein